MSMMIATAHPHTLLLVGFALGFVAAVIAFRLRMP